LESTNPAADQGEQSNPPDSHSSGRPPSFASNLAWRAIANWSSQLVSWVALLVVVRVLSPSDFGIVGMSMVLYSYLKFLGGFGITQTVIRHRELSDEALAQLNTLGVMFGAGSFLLAALCAWPVALFFKTPRVAAVAVVTCIGLIPLGFRGVPEGLMNQKMRLKSLSLFDALRDIFGAGVLLVLAWLGFGYWALVLGNLLSEVLRGAIVLKVQPYRFAWPRLAVVKEPLTFGWRSLVASFAWSTYNTLDNVTAARVLGQAALGFYGMAWNLANMPLEKIVTLVTTLVPSYLARVQTDMTAMRHYVRSLTEAIALAMFPASLGLALVARELVPLAMGHKWDPMIGPLQVLSIYAAFRSLVALLPRVITISGHVRFVMRVEVSGLILMPLAFWIGSHWGILGIAYGWVVAYPVVALPHYWKALKLIDMKPAEYIRALRPALDGSLAMALAVTLLKLAKPRIHSSWILLIAEIVVGAAVYVAALALAHRDRFLYYLSFTKRLPGVNKFLAQPSAAQ
jgi:teichuronic acid exporter